MGTLRRGFMALAMIAGVGLAGAATTAHAEGVPYGARTQGPPVERPPIWRGAYGGLHLGYADVNDDDVFLGGVQLGYNWQSNRVVYGLEGDISLFGSSSDDSVDLMGSVRGRLGYLIAPNFLLYGTAGLGIVGKDDTETGFVYGVGVESLITDTMTARLEYLNFDLDSNDVGVIRVGLNIKVGP